jgi:hypothetical protein
LCSSAIGNRQENTKQGARSVIACELYSSTVHLDCPARYRQTKSDATLFPGTARVYPVESVEDAITMSSGNAWPGILHLDYRLSRVQRLQLDIYCATVWCVFYRVVNQIHQGLPQ